MTIQSNNNNLNNLIDPTFLQKSTDYLHYHLKELLKKIMQQKIIEILFQINIYLISK